MSAFIVQDNVINRIVSKVRDNRSGLEHPFKYLGYDLKGNREDCERLAVDLHLLNCDGVDDRYGKGTAAHDVAVCFQYRYSEASLIQVYKHAQCLRYQCAEGDVRNRPLFKALDQFVKMLADTIIRTYLPEYEKAQWDATN